MTGLRSYHFIFEIAGGGKEIFTSPPAQMFLEASKSADGGKGVACLYGDYAGDVMDVTLAIEPAAEAEPRRVSLVQVGDKTLMDAFLPGVEVTADSMGRLLSDGGQG